MADGPICVDNMGGLDGPNERDFSVLKNYSFSKSHSLRLQLVERCFLLPQTSFSERTLGKKINGTASVEAIPNSEDIETYVVRNNRFTII